MWQQEVRAARHQLPFANNMQVYDDQGRRRFHGAFTGGFSAGYFNTVGSKEGWTPSSFRSSRSDKAREASAVKSRPEDYMDEEDLADLRRATDVRTRDAYAPGAAPGDHDPLLGVLLPQEHDAVRASGAGMGQQLLRRMGWKPGHGIGPLVSHARREQLAALAQDMHAGPSGHTASKASQTRGTNEHDEAKRHLYPPPDTPMLPVSSNRERRGLGASPSGGRSLDRLLSEYHAKDARLEAEAATDAGTGAVWHDGRALPNGYVLASQTEQPAEEWHTPPAPPAGWTPDPRRVWTQFPHTAPAQAPQRAEERRTILGEAPQPGPPPVVSNYLSAKAQERLRAAKANAPASAAPGAATDAPPAEPTAVRVPSLDPETARRALQGFTSGADPAKDARYRAYLKQAERNDPEPPAPAPGQSAAELQAELDEFHQTASIFRPVSGAMANRFTTASTGGSATRDAPRLPEISPAQRAAREEKFGPLTRSETPFRPPRLLCKRLGVPPPQHDEDEAPEAPEEDAAFAQAFARFGAAPPGREAEPPGGVSAAAVSTEAEEQAALREDAALHEERPPLDLFRAVFAGEESDEEIESGSATQQDASVPHVQFQRRRKAEDAAVSGVKPKAKRKERRVGPLTFDLDEEDSAAVPVRPQKRTAPQHASNEGLAPEGTSSRTEGRRRVRASDLF